MKATKGTGSFYLRPENIDEALNLMANGEVSIMAGGTSLVRSARRTGWARHKAVMDISRAVGPEIEIGDEKVMIGAMAVCSDISSARFPPFLAAIAEAAGSLASTPLRNLITLGGNVVQTFPWSCLPVAFLAVGGAAVSRASGRGPENLEILHADDLFAGHPMKTVGRGALITSFEFDFPASSFRASAFERISLTSFDYPVATAASSIETDSGVISFARVVVGGILQFPRRIREIELMLIGMEPDRLDLKEISRLAASLVEAVPLPGGLPREYRTRMAGLAAARSISRAANSAAATLPGVSGSAWESSRGTGAEG